MFGHAVLKPEIGRKPAYDNLYNRAGRHQFFSCVSCGKVVPIDIASCAGQEGHDPETVLGPENGVKVREHFGILSKSLANGWPFLKVHVCPNCENPYIVYVAAFEPHNGWVQVVLQGVSELLPSNYSLKRTAAGRLR